MATNIADLAKKQLTKQRCEQLLEVLWTNALRGDLNAAALYLELAGFIRQQT